MRLEALSKETWRFNPAFHYKNSKSCWRVCACVGVWKSADFSKNLGAYQAVTYIVFISWEACGYVQIHFLGKMNSLESSQLVSF